MPIIHEGSFHVRRTAILAVLVVALGLILQFGVSKADAATPANGFSAGFNEQKWALPGSTVELQWDAPAPGEHFLVASDIPDFGSSTRVKWPSGSDAIWSSSWNWWSTTSRKVEVAIPSTAKVGETFNVRLYTCTTSPNECSNTGNPSAPCGVALPGGGYPCALTKLTSSGAVFTRGGNEQIRVVPGSKVSLHWEAPETGEYYLVSSDIPDFGNSAKTQWPNSSGATWNGTWGWWSTSYQDVQVTIPSTATAGQAYHVRLYTCTTSPSVCSNTGTPSATCGVALPGGGFPCTQATLTATGGSWNAPSYTSDYSTKNNQSQNVGNGLDVMTDSSGVSWNTSEFSNTLGRSTHGGNYSTQYSLPKYVQPGNTTKLSWDTKGDPDYYLIASSSPTALPNFAPGVGSNIDWEGASAAWNSTWGWYSTTAKSMKVKVPSVASLGTTYGFQVYACDATKCSNSAGSSSTGPYGGVLNLSVAAAPAGVATDRTNAPFTNCFLKTSAPCSAPSYSNCFVERPGCSGVPWSALSERVISAQGKIWMTQGGWLFDLEYSPGPPLLAQPNDSQIVSFDPVAQTFCTYQVPGDDTEVIGMAAQGDRIFFLETFRGGHPSYSWGDPYEPGPGESRLAYFKPSDVGNGCPNGKSNYYPAGSGGLNACPVVEPGSNPSTPSNCNMIELGPWGSELPAHIIADSETFDGTGGTLWVSNWRFGDIDRFEIENLSTGKFSYAEVPLPMHADATAGKIYKFTFPWQITQDDDYVYAVNYGDNHVDRIDKSTLALTQEAVPVRSDREQLHSAVVSGGKLYFTLADDAPDRPLMSTSSFGAIGLGSWGASAPPTNARIYSGLDAAYGSSLPYSVAPNSHANFRGIDVAGNGTVTLANQYGVVSVAP